MIFEIRLHGIGGQGVAAAADLLALSAVRDGMWAHSFPFFGTEIRGGIVTAFARISPEPIHDRSFIYEPNLIVIFSPHLFDKNTCKGARNDTVILINTSRLIESFPTPQKGKVITLDANRIASEIPGCKLGNAALLGAMVAIIPEFRFESLETSFKEKFSSEAAQANILGAHAGFKRYTEMERVP